MNWAGELLFGESWAIFSGTAAHNTPHAHAAVQVAIGIDADVVVQSSDGTEYRGRAMVVRPLVQHSLVATAEVVILYVEPQSPLAFMIADQIGDADIAELDPGKIAVRTIAGHHCMGEPAGRADTSWRRSSRFTAKNGSNAVKRRARPDFHCRCRPGCRPVRIAAPCAGAHPAWLATFDLAYLAQA